MISSRFSLRQRISFRVDFYVRQQGGALAHGKIIAHILYFAEKGFETPEDNEDITRILGNEK
jgi:hypothetical protein